MRPSCGLVAGLVRVLTIATKHRPPFLAPVGRFARPETPIQDEEQSNKNRVAFALKNASAIPEAAVRGLSWDNRDDDTIGSVALVDAAKRVTGRTALWLLRPPMVRRREASDYYDNFRPKRPNPNFLDLEPVWPNVTARQPIPFNVL
ncbi:hypothetical protein F5B21DRAFT_506241 [Xylaria acuta]|nr:hypothetical protein F5B21DRAFT_506241 [Xylaria acuta]